MNYNLKFLNLFEFRKFLTILEVSEKKNLFFLFFLMFIASFLEMLSIGIVIPLINSLLNPETIDNSVLSFIPKLSSDSSDLNYINFIIRVLYISL